MKFSSLIAAAACLGASVTLGQAAATYSVERQVRFIDGDANMRAGLSRQPSVRDLVAGAFSISVEDLDDDGKREVIVVASSSDYCGSGGCLTVVLRNTGNGQMESIFQQNLFPELGVTREKVNGYRLLAALDGNGGIALGDKPGTPLFGKPLVYPMTLAAAAQSSAASSASSPPAATAGGSSAGGGVDVLGIRPGKSTIAEVRSALGAVKPAVSLMESQMQLAGRSASAAGTSGPIEVGAPFPRLIEAVTRPYRSDMCGGTSTQGPQTYCEVIRVSFSAPPSAGIAQVVRRDIYFGSGGPAIDRMIASLTDKYGPAVFQQSFGDGGRSRQLNWAWDAAGRPVALNERHACANRRGAISAAGMELQEEQRRAGVHLEAGCVTTLQADVGGLNGIVSGAQLIAVDHRAVNEFNTLTGRSVDEQVADKERKAREKAGAVAVPDL
jgi:hypothetical protein